MPLNRLKKWFGARPPAGVWDDDVAATLPGALVLVGLTRRLSDGDQLEQMFGRVVVAERDQGICIALEGSRTGDHYWMPPDTRGLQRAERGEYRLRSTGEVVIDPDFICSWTIHPGDPA